MDTRIPMIPTTTLLLTDVETGASQGAAYIRLESKPMWQWLITTVIDGF